MNAMRSTKWGLGVAAIAGALASLPGCELLVQFDRSLIDAGEPDSTTPDSGGVAPGSDASAADSPSETATGDDGGSAADAPAETSVDAPVGVDAPVDAPTEAVVDEGVIDAPPEAAAAGDDGSADSAPSDDGGGDDGSGNDSGSSNDSGDDSG